MAVTNLRIIDEFGVLTLNSKESPLNKINNVIYNLTVIQHYQNRNYSHKTRKKWKDGMF